MEIGALCVSFLLSSSVLVCLVCVSEFLFGFGCFLLWVVSFCAGALFHSCFVVFSDSILFVGGRTSGAQPVLPLDVLKDLISAASEVRIRCELEFF